MNIRRAAEHNEVMAAIHPHPKPTKENKTKRVPVEKRRKRLEKQIADIAKLIIFWRDGQRCVMDFMDGSRCGNGLMWNHVISQSQSSWLRIDLGNIVCGCGNHNLLDFHGDKTLTLWYCKNLGVHALQALQQAAREHAGQKRTEAELEAILEHYDQLYQSRYTAELDFMWLIDAGYYGDIVKAVYVGK